MKLATTILLTLGTSTANAFMIAPATKSTTALADYHYRNGAAPDPSSTASNKSYEVEKRRKSVKRVSEMIELVHGPQETVRAPTHNVQENQKKGLNRVFADWETGFSADGLQRESN